MTTNNNGSGSLPAPQSGGQVALSPEMLEMMEGAAHATDFSAGQTLVPYVQIVQATSGYVKRNTPDFIESARVGDIINTLTLRLSSVRHIIPCKFELHYTEWKPNNGPLVRQYFADSRPYDALPWRRNEQTGEEMQFGPKATPNGNEIVPSAVYYCLDYEPESGQSVASVLSLTSTQFPKQRRLNSLMNMEMDGPNGPFIPPMFARIYDCTTVSETGGPNGDKEWAGWRFEPGLLTLTVPHGNRLFAKAKAFREAIEAGKVRPRPPQENLANADDGGASAGPSRQTGSGPAVLDDDIPFD